MSVQVRKTVTISVVSHLQGQLVSQLLSDIAIHCAAEVEVLVTVNMPEQLPFREDGFAMPVRIVRNSVPRGFGANHNAAFSLARGEAFCVMNPDIRLVRNPFPALMEVLREERVGLVAPAVEDPQGNIEDSARRFPTVRSLILKALGWVPQLDYHRSAAPFSPDWVGGMFMLFRPQIFAALHGFDERYFLYYEDVDICRRLRRGGFDVKLVSEARVVHSAQRASRRSLRHVRWHLASMWRFLTTR